MMQQPITQQTKPINVSSSNQPLVQWQLLEMVQVVSDPFEPDAGAPMQLLKFAGSQPELQGPIVILAGFEGPAKNDGRILQLLQKAVSSTVVRPVSDLYVVPVANPTAREKSSYLNEKGQDILHDFPTQSQLSGSDIGPSMEVGILTRWLAKIQPKAIFSIRAGQPLFRHCDVSQDVLDKLQSLAERPVLELNQKIPLADGEEEVPHNLQKSLGQWCQENSILWIEFSVDGGKRSFEEVREDWRINVGPAFKWLLEGPRFNPPAEDTLYVTPTVVPTLDLPPELANL
jgi:hypothetical protein